VPPLSRLPQPATTALLTCYVVVLTTVAVALVAGDRTSAEPAR